jgi:hypothetical protein
LEPTRVIYRYPPEKLFAKYFWFVVAFFVVAWVPVWAVFQRTPGRNFFDLPLVVELGLLFSPLAALVILVNIFLSHRPVEIDDSAITALVGTRAFRKILWAGVSCMEKSRWFDQVASRYRVTYSIIGMRAKIKIQEELVGLPQLLDSLNAQSIKNGIEIISVDYGLDTRRTALANESDFRKRRDIRRGVRARLTHL